MANFAQVDDNNIVVNVLTANDEYENEGHDWLVENFGGRWIKTSYNTRGGVHRLGGEPLRKNFAGIGMTYDEARDAFLYPKPFPSWILNEDSCLWEPPIQPPSLDTFEKTWEWDEESLSWN